MTARKDQRRPLTQRQQDLLDFIKEFSERQKYPPTFKEIRDGLAWSTKSLVDYHLLKLEEYGYIKRARHAARAIEIVE